MMACIPTPRWKWRQACHLFSESLPELHAFAARIGLKHSWFQRKPGKLPHYDLTDNMRAKAIAAGAIEVVGARAIVEAHARCGDEQSKNIIECLSRGPTRVDVSEART
jgi:hypothetical protein